MKRLGCVSIGVLLILGACSSDSKKSTSTTAASSAPAATTTGATTAATTGATTAGSTAETTAPSQPAETKPVSDAGGPPGDSCAIVSPDDVTTAFGGTVAAGVANPDTGGCDFDISGTTKTGDVDVFAQVTVEYGQADYIDAAEEKKVAPDVVEVPDVGDAAWYLDISLSHQLHISVNGTELLVYATLPGDPAAIKAELIDFATGIIANL